MNPPRLAWQERPLAELLRLSWPSVLSLLSVSTMSLVDSVFLGHLGSVELAAGGLGGVSVFTVLSFGLALFGAAKVEVGLRYGAGDAQGVRRCLGGLLRVAFVLGLISTVVGELAAFALPYLSADRQTGIMAGQYAAVRALSFPFALCSTALGGWLQAQGNSKTAMHSALLANIINVPLNYLMIFVWEWGIWGAAWSTVICRLIELLWLVRKQVHGVAPPAPNAPPIQRGLHLNQGTLRDGYRSLRIGLPAGLERVLDMAAFAAVPILLSQLGPLHVAAHQIVLQIMMFSFLPLMAFNESVSLLISQALGAQAPRLVVAISRLGMGCALLYGLACSTLIVVATGPLVSMFTTDESLIVLGNSTLLIGAVLQLINSVYSFLKGILRGMSAFRYVAWVTVGCAWIITPPLTYVLGVRRGWGAEGAWMVLTFEVTVGLIIMAVRVRRDLSRLVHSTEAEGIGS